MIDICCGWSGVKNHSLCYWSIVMMSHVEFRLVNFMPDRYQKSFKIA